MKLINPCEKRNCLVRATCADEYNKSVAYTISLVQAVKNDRPITVKNDNDKRKLKIIRKCIKWHFNIGVKNTKCNFEYTINPYSERVVENFEF